MRRKIIRLEWVMQLWHHNLVLFLRGIAQEILAILQQYDADVIEVIGHTDPQPMRFPTELQPLIRLLVIL